MSSRIPRALIIFHRHGHRSPSKNIIPNNDGRSNELCPNESKMWARLCNITDSADSLDKLHPITIPPRIKVPNDMVSFPFGCLTTLGLKCLDLQASSLCNLFPYLKSFDVNYGQNAFICCTNYKRTQVN